MKKNIKSSKKKEITFSAVMALIKKHALFLIILLFLLQSFFFSLTVKKTLAPDENYHVRVSQYHSESINPFIKNKAERSLDGNVETIPFLYHYINGMLLHLNPGIDDTIYLRLFNPVLGACSLFILYKIAQELTGKKNIAIATVFLYANTLMIIFLSSAVNYDNLIILLSHLSIYALVIGFKYKNPKQVLLSILYSLLGALTLFTFTPISLFIIFANLIIVIKYKKIFWQNVHKLKYTTLIFLFFVLLIVAILNFKIYVMNYVEYHTIKPDCTIVLSHEECMKYYPYKRNYGFKETAKNLPTQLNLIEYSGHWTYQMVRGIYGLTLHSLRYFNYPSTAALALLGILAIKNYKSTFRKDFLMVLFAFALSYLLLIFVYNYKEYLVYKVAWMAVQGRYAFPILGIVYLFLNRLVMKDYRSTIWKIIFILAYSLFFFANISFYFFAPIEKILNLKA